MQNVKIWGDSRLKNNLRCGRIFIGGQHFNVVMDSLARCIVILKDGFPSVMTQGLILYSKQDYL